MFARLKDWRRRRILARHALPDALWAQRVARLRVLRGLDAGALARLRELATLFLHAKRLVGAHDMTLTDAMRIDIAAQAVLPILNLDLDYYAGWHSVIVYPGAFLVPDEEWDEAGVVHEWEDERTGESWERGPVVLSWPDARAAHARDDGTNLVIHEFSHKLDMLSGDANGMPPLHRDMDRRAWTAAFSAGYAQFCARVDSGEDTAIDPYAAEDPAEFFAVLSEYFFEAPQLLRAEFPDIYAMMCRFYRQDPAARRATAG